MFGIILLLAAGAASPDWFVDPVICAARGSERFPECRTTGSVDNVEMPMEEGPSAQDRLYQRSPESLRWLDPAVYPWLTCALNNLRISENMPMHSGDTPANRAALAIDECTTARKAYGDYWTFDARASDAEIEQRTNFVRARMIALLGGLLPSY